MPKRRAGVSGDRLTGGTHDVNPQWLSLPRVTMATNDTTIEAQFPLPVVRFPERDGSSIVVEVLKVFWDISTNYNTATALNVIDGFLRTKPLPATTPVQTGITDGGTIDYVESNIGFLGSPTSFTTGVILMVCLRYLFLCSAAQGGSSHRWFPHHSRANCPRPHR